MDAVPCWVHMLFRILRVRDWFTEKIWCWVNLTSLGKTARLLPTGNSLILKSESPWLSLNKIKIRKLILKFKCSFSSVKSLSHVWLFGTLWSAARHSSLSINNSQSLLKLMSIELVMLPNHLILRHPLLLPSIFPSISIFSSELLFASGDQSIRASVSASVLPMNIQGWFPLGLTGLITLLSKRLSRVFSSTTIGKHQFFGAQPSLWSTSHIHGLTWLREKP